MSLTVGTIISIALIATATVIDWLCDVWGSRTIAPVTLCTAPMSETDVEMQIATKAVLKEALGEDINATIQELSAAERITKAEELIDRLQELYGLDVEVDFYGDTYVNCGRFNYHGFKLELNVANLLAREEERVLNFIDTIIHELRHAVQCKAICEEGFWNVSEETKKRWLDNIKNYITVTVDPKGYANQPVELDARTFASGCLREVA